MRTKSATQKNTAPGIKPISPWRLTKVKALMNYKLKVYFVDGTHGLVDMRHLIMDKKAGVFAILKDKKLFDQVCLEYGAVTWPVGVDLAPDAMYEEIKKIGAWTP